MKEFFKKNKMLLTSIFTFLVAILAVCIAGFAWFADSETGRGSLVETIGDLGSLYQFGQVFGGNDGIVEPPTQGLFEYREIMPGSVYTFALSVANDGDIEGYFDVYLYKVLSYYLQGDDKDSNYDERRLKIQYAFTYEVSQVYWVPYAHSLMSINIDQDNPFPTEEYIETNGWIHWNSQEMLDYLPEGMYVMDGDSGYTQPLYFNKEKNEGEDQENYYMIEQARLYPQNVDYHSAFVMFFQINFLNEAMLPDSLVASGVEKPNSNVYINQIIEISNIVIVAMKE